MSDHAVSPQHLAEAADWHLRLSDSAATPEDHAAWRLWLSQADGHRAAWQRVGRLKDLLAQSPAQSRQALARSPRLTRRRALAGIGAAGGLGAMAMVAVVMRPWRAPETPIDWVVTGPGERRTIRLPDGGELTLNAESRVGIAYGATLRTLHLTAGALQLTTAPDAERRPLHLQTRDGRITPLGTRFTVAQIGPATVVAVQAHAVEVLPLDSAFPMRVAEGQRLRFYRGGHDAVGRAGFADDAWTRGVLVAMDQALEDFLQEFQRQSGKAMGCDASIAKLRVSGSFLTTQPQQSLATLADQLGLRLEQRDQRLMLRAR